jgi:3-phosphoinositide dependent protein kinase-1
MYFDKKQMKFIKIEEKENNKKNIKEDNNSSNDNYNSNEKNLHSEDEDDKENDLHELVGTAEYVSPEVLTKQIPTSAVDLWALGCIIYLFFHGKTPFKDKNDMLIFDKILHKEPKFSEVKFYILNYYY